MDLIRCYSHADSHAYSIQNYVSVVSIAEVDVMPLSNPHATPPADGAVVQTNLYKLKVL